MHDTGDELIRAARVLKVKRTTRQAIGQRDVTAAVHGVEIRAHGDGLFLVLRLDMTGNAVADTAHFSLDEAMRQAEFEYELVWSGEFRASRRERPSQ